MSLFLRIVVIFFVAAFASGVSRAQSSVIYGRPDVDEEGYEVIPTADGGYMSGGQFTDTTGNVQYWVVKVDAKGNVAWDSVYRLGYDREFLWSIQPDGTGGALLAGYTGVQNSGTESALVVDIDSVGRIIKHYDLNYARADHAHWFAHRAQGGYFWAGHTDSESDSSGVMILMHLDENFDSVWQKTYTYRPNSSEHAHCGTLTSDGGCVLAGHTYDGSHEHTWAVRVDSNGNVVWKKAFASSNNGDDSPYGIITTREGNFAMFGGVGEGNTSDARLLVVDAAGNTLVDKSYGNGTAYGFDGFQTSDGGFVVVGGEQLDTLTTTAVAVRTDTKGNAIWTKDYTGMQNAYGYSGFQHKGQYVLIGTTWKTGANFGDYWAINVDTNGNQVAYDTSATKAQHGFAFTMESRTITYSLVDFNVPYDTLYGSIANTGEDSITVVVSATYAPQWVIFASVAGKNLSFSGHDTLTLAPHASVPVVARIVPYAERADTEFFCLSVATTDESVASQEHCSTLIVTVPSAVTGAVASRKLTLWPNPADKFITLGGASNAVDYRIYNAAGALLLSGTSRDRIDVSSLAEGAYEIVIGGHTHSFLVQR